MSAVAMETPKPKPTQPSPIPMPDPTVFQSRFTLSSADKRKNGKTPSSKPQCPSPPSKSPPMSRFGLNSQLYTPVAQPISVDTFKTPASVKSNTSNNPAQPTPYNQVRTPFPTQTDFFDTEFINLGVAGAGSFATVYMVRSKFDNQMYAIKKKKKQYRGTQDRERAIREFQAGFSLAPHPNCLRYYSAWEESGFLYIQTELCKGTLHDYVRTQDEIPEDRIWHFLLDLALGLQHIHSYGLIHLDIKPSNILIGFDGSLKIADFGLATKAESWRPGIDSEGDFRYMAPELLKEGFRDDEQVVDFSVDVFSLGTAIFEVAANINEMPKGGEDWAYLRSGRVSFSEVPNAPKRSADLEKLVRRMMHPNPERRITIQKLLQHKILSKLMLNRSTATSAESSDIMEIEEPELLFDRSELEKMQREQQRRESLESDMGGKIQREEIESAHNYPPIAPKKLSFDLCE
eukprot:TRINITY_DN9513_c0_g1_i1.p1 TRINITY_DN9513_c0_g1~~TRINITY_DN9513_c0_g1_i1.p1  ORF type:complete len:460 (+),score=80.65 TRINITY_DN9513_c0_g1_i1:234-1613(+)